MKENKHPSAFVSTCIDAVCFMLCLIDVAITNFVEYKGEYGNCWPLLPEVRTVLRESYAEIIKLLNVDDDMINALVSRGCFTQQQLDDVSCISGQRKRCMKLLDMILRSSMGNYNICLQYMKKINMQCTPLLEGSAGKEINFTDNF
jgi:hypothetical protein